MLSDTLFNSVQIEQADARTFLSRQKPDSIDLILTSPPYAMQRKDSYGGIPADDYVDWWMSVAAPMQSVLKDTGSLILNIKEHVERGERHPYVYQLVLEMTRCGWYWLDELIWHKPNPMPFHHHNRLRDGFERLYHFAKHPQIKMRHDAVRQPAAESTIRRVSNLTETDRTSRPSSSGSGLMIGGMSEAVVERGAVPSNVLTWGVVGYNTGHPAAFPAKLPEFFIKLLTDEGDVVCDPFAGSGTTLKQALRLGRHAIGCDITLQYMGEGAGVATSPKPASFATSEENHGGNTHMGE